MCVRISSVLTSFRTFRSCTHHYFAIVDLEGGPLVYMIKKKNFYVCLIINSTKTDIYTHILEFG